MYPMVGFPREKRLRWFGHTERRDKDEATRNILTVDGKRNRGRLKLRWRDMVKEDIWAEYRKHWHVMIQAGTLRTVEADR